MGIKIWDKFFNCKPVATKKVYPISFGFQTHLEKHINNVFCLTFSYEKTWA
jgi:hypothetical protein